MFARFARITRNFSTSLGRKSHEPGGVPGVNLPFGIDNKYRLTLLFILYFGSGAAVPFLVVRHQLTK